MSETFRFYSCLAVPEPWGATPPLHRRKTSGVNANIRFSSRKGWHDAWMTDQSWHREIPPEDSLLWQHFWVGCLGVWCAAHQLHWFKTTATVPLEWEIEVSWFYPRTHPTRLEMTSLTSRLFSCSHTALQQTNWATGGEIPRLEAISLRAPVTPKQQQLRHRLGN